MMERSIWPTCSGAAEIRRAAVVWIPREITLTTSRKFIAAISAP